MMDATYVEIVFGFFILSAALVNLCEELQRIRL